MHNILAARLRHGATRIHNDAAASRVARVAIAQLYARCRDARRYAARDRSTLGPDHPAAQASDGAAIEAWNALQSMKQVLGSVAATA
ncbi:hypothetical protein [Sphingosinicella sp. BN140058]|uniref:hypothetical protein n=1 Tax=Sphingosinicella sp. BN140058 TaxID=1892855 RepID=UPI001011D68F|nr:hypothetical protein [Sphingosinicella sp. BN140058]QAY80247.1 hypothetical protein ETR14_26755 [Sphingosinicella sp. BN140058]